MRFIRRRLVAILVIASIVIFGELAFAGVMQRNQELIQPPIKITQAFKEIAYNPSFPENGNVVLGNPDSQEQEAINQFAWRVFIALNWPVDCQGKTLSSIERPGEKKLIGQAPENPRTWELYPSPQDLFLPKGAEPPPLNNVPEDDRCLNDGAGSEIEYQQSLRLTETGELAGEHEFREVETAMRTDLLDGYGELKSEVDSVPGIKGKPVKISLSDIDAANQIPLVDSQGNYVVHEVRINPIEYNQIRDNKWYDATKLEESIKSNDPFKFMCSEKFVSTANSNFCNQCEAEGAIEIKAVWRVFDERNSTEEKARYYTTNRKIVDRSGKLLEKAKLGLIGFHIMQKTSFQGWIWSTFEHIDNAASCDDSTKPYTLYNNECKTGKCQQNKPYVKQPYFWHISNDDPKAVTLEEIAIKDQTPSQICRVNKISTSANQKNKIWQKRLSDIDKSSVWQYYQLIGTQWLGHPELPYTQTNADSRVITPKTPPLTNIAIEPYAQGVSCIVCHTSARLPGTGSSCQLMTEEGEQSKITACADFSFLMDNARSSKQPSARQN